MARKPTRNTAAAQRILHLNEARWQAVLDTNRDAIISIDGSGRICLFNRSAEAIFGYAAADVVGRNVKVLMAEPYRREHDEYIRRYRETGVPRAIGRIRAVEARRKNGEVFPVELSVTETPVDGDVIYTAVLRDVTDRKEAEEALRRERDFAERLIQAAPMIVLVLDPQGRVVRFNRYLEEVSGYSLEETRGADWFETFLPARDRENVRQIFSHVIGHDPVRSNINPIVTKGGVEREIEWHSRTLRDGQGRIIGLLAVGQDITGRRRAERRLSTQYAVTRALAESGSFADTVPLLLESIGRGAGCEIGEFWEIDERDGALRLRGAWHAPYVAARAFLDDERAHPLAPGEGLPGRVHESGEPVWVSDLTADAKLAQRAAVRRLGLRAGFGFPVGRPEARVGAMVFFSRRIQEPQRDWVKMLDALTRQIGDFIERKRMEGERSELAAIVASSEDAIIGRTPEGIITSWNAGAEKLYGYAAAEAVGRSVALLLPPDRRDELDHILQRTRRGESIDQYETVRVRRDGSRVDVSLSVSPIRDAEGRVVGASAIARDITERKRVEAALSELQRLAQQRERLADVGAITAKIIHDVGNPLAALSLQAQLVLRRARRDPEQPVGSITRTAEQILAEAQRLEGLVREFMSFTGEQRLDLAPIELSPFLRQVVEAWRPVARARAISLELDAAGDIAPFGGDEEKLRRVFDNLVKNAVEAIERGPGVIVIRLSVPSSEKVRISVEDTGPGISEGLKVFNLFETTKAGGTGLGLAVAREIVLAHGGSIDYFRREPHGTIFQIELRRDGGLW
jgi:PAS domain S-box-containing protein